MKEFILNSNQNIDMNIYIYIHMYLYLLKPVYLFNELDPKRIISYKLLSLPVSMRFSSLILLLCRHLQARLTAAGFHWDTSWRSKTGVIEPKKCRFLASRRPENECISLGLQNWSHFDMFMVPKNGCRSPRPIGP